MNHFVKNIITKGWLNISAITKGFILPFFKYVIVTKKSGGSSAYAYEEEDFYKRLREAQKQDDIELIKVYVDWSKKSTKQDKHIYAELIKKTIEAKLIKNDFKDILIDVEIISDTNKIV